MERRTEMLPVVLPNGVTIRVESTLLGGEEEVDLGGALPFKDVSAALEGISSVLVDALKKVNPQKASVEFGLEVALESGALTSLLVKGTGTANLKVTLEWGAASA